jgi:hypothetical protein
LAREGGSSKTTGTGIYTKFTTPKKIAGKVGPEAGVLKKLSLASLAKLLKAKPAEV